MKNEILTLVSRRSPAGLFSLALLFGPWLQPAQAQSSYTWNGGSGTSGNWSDGNNWGGSGPGSPQAFLNFNGATRTSSTNDFAAASAGYQIYFKSGANAFTLYGNSIAFYDFGGGNPNIQNEGAFTNQTVNFPILDGNTANSGILNINVNTGTAQGPLTFNGTVSAADANLATRPINVSGSNTVTFNGIISDFSSSGKIAVTQLGSGITTLRATNTFTGDLSVNAGTVVLATNSALANSGNFIRLGDTAGSTGANLNLNSGNNLSTPINVRSGSSGTKTIANTSGTTGNASFLGSLYLDADATAFANAVGTNIFSSSTLDMKNQTLTISGTGATIISGTLTNSTGSGKIVTSTSAGPLTLSGANFYTGGTTLGSSATININNATALGTGTFTVGGNGNFDNTSGGTISNANNNAFTLSGGSPTFTGTTNLNFGNGVVTISGANRTLTVSANTLTLGGGITDAGGTRKFTKAGSGTLVLAGAAGTWTGGMQVDAGIVQANANDVFGTGNTTNNGGRVLLNGVTITNTLVMAAVNPGTGLGALQGVDTTTSTWSGPILVNSNSASGGHIVGPTTSGLLTISGAVTIGGTATTLAVRDGIVRFSGGGSYTNMTINSGTTSLGANNGLATTAIVDVGPTSRTTLDLNGFNQTLAGIRNTSLGAQTDWITNSVAATPSTLTLAVSNSALYGGSIVGNIAVNVTGGTQVITNSGGTANGIFGYSGDTTVSGGTLKAASSNILPNGSGKGNLIVTNTGILDLNGTSHTINGLYGNGVVGSLGNVAATLTVGNTSVNSLFSGLVTNAVTLTVTNPNAILVMSGVSNTFSGGVNIGNGSVNFRSGVVRAAATQTLGTGTVTVGNGGNESTGRLELSNNISLNNTVVLPQRNNNSVSVENLSGNNTNAGTFGLTSGGSFAIVQVDAGTLTLGAAGTTAVSNQVTASTRILTLQGAGNGTVAGNIIDVGTAVISLMKDGAGTWTLSGVNTFSGDTRVTNGTLTVNSTTALQSSTVDMNSTDSGTLNMNNVSATLGGLKGSRNLALGTGTVSVGNNGVANTYSGVLSGNALTKVGTGAWTLTGNHTYTGATTVSAGELIGQTGGSCSNSAVSVSAGATNGVVLAAANGQWVCSNLTYAAASSVGDLNFSSNALSTTTAPILVNSNLTFTATPVFIVRATSGLTNGQYPLIKYNGTLSGTPPVLATFIAPAGLGAMVSNNVANKSIDLVVTNGTIVYWATGSAIWDINTTANWKDQNGTSEKYLDGDFVVLDDNNGAASPTLSLAATVTPAMITANLTNKSYTIATNVAGVAISGSAPLVKNGSGTLSFNMANAAYTGTVALNAGTLGFGAGGSIGTGTITMSNGTTITLPNNGNSASIGNPITIPAGASVTFSTTALGNGIGGNVTSGDSTSVINISGSVSFSATTRQLDPFTGTVNVPSGATLRFSATSGTDGSTNAAFVVNGTLQQRNAAVGPYVLGSLTGSGNIGPNQTVAGTGTTTWQVGTNNASTTFSGKFLDFGSIPGTTTNLALVKMGTGTFTVSGNSPHSGATTVGAGSLMGVTGGSFSNSPVTVNSGATNGVTLASVNGNWVCTNLTFAAGTETEVINFSGIVPSTTVAPIQMPGGLALNGTVNFIVIGGSTTIPVGTYPLIAYGGALSGAGAVTQTPLAMPNLVSGYITNDTVNKMIALVVTNVIAPPQIVWSAGTGNWDFSSSNWTNLTTAALVAWADTNVALFNDTASGSGPFTVTLNTNVMPVGTTFNNSAKDYTLTGTGSITGNDGLTKTGTGTLTIANSNTFTAATTISAGTLVIGSGGTSGSLANMAIVDNGALVINRSDAVAISTVITGTGSFTNAGGGTTTVSVTNSYAGNTTVKAGTLQMTDTGNLSPGSTLVMSGGQFTRASQNFTPNKSNAYKFGLAVNADSTVATTSTTTRTVHFDSTNVTAVPGTTLLVTNAAATGTNHFKLYTGGFNYAGNLILGGNGGNNMTFLESYNTNDTQLDQIFSGVISGAGKIYKNIEGSSPGGNLILSNSANSFSGATELRAGYIGLGADNPLGTNRVTFGFDFNPLGFYAVDAARTLANDIYADANSASASTAAGCTNLTIKGSQNLTLSGRIFICTNVQFFIVNNTALTTFSGAISNAAANSLGIAKLGAGTLVVSGNNTYSGDTFVNVGMLRLGASGVIPDGAGKGNLSVASTLDLNMFSETVNGLNGAGVIDTVAGGTPTLTVGNNNAAGSFSGAIQNTAGTLSLTKTGSGLQTLSGMSTYSGNTTVAQGTLTLSGVGSIANSPNLAVSAGALLDVSAVTGGFTLGAAQTLSGFGSVKGALTNNGTISPGASIGTLTLSNAPVLNGTVVMELNRTNAQNTDKLVLTAGTLNYGGALIVTNIGDALTNGDTFVVFSASGYAGAFTNIVLPALDSSLVWNTNNLAVNGSLSVVLGIQPTALTLTSSSNPSGYLDALTFTATLAPTNATGNVTFYNGATPFSTNALSLGVAVSGSISSLARGTNTITAAYLGNVNYYGSTNSLAQVVTNHPPVAANVNFYRNAGISTLHVSIADLLTNVTDVDLDTIMFVTNSASTNGATMLTSGGFIHYSNTNSVNDQFTYTVDDANGGTTTANVNIVVNPFVTGQSTTITVSGSTATVGFFGIPGYGYGVQRSTNLTSWATILTTNAPSNGAFEWTDDFSDLGVVPASAYYRLQWIP